jgi:drug/metabolite transporter (DMT)-like permease
VRISGGYVVSCRQIHRQEERAMLKELLGPGLVLVFAVTQAFRDVYFANAFQGIDFFFVIALAFSISTVMFAAVTAIREPAAFARMRRELPALAWINVTTAVAWISYFYSLKHLQPSVVNTLHSGAGPLTVILLASFGIHIARPSAVRQAELVCHAGLAASLGVLCWAVLAGESGLRTDGFLLTVAGLVLPIVSGASITISLLWCKRLNERGIGADAITAGRYLLIIAIALLVEVVGDRPTGIGTPGQALSLGVAATILIVLPLYSLQVGVAHTPPLTAHVIRSLGPALIFGLELADGRIAYSGLILAGIALYSLFALASNLVRGWQGERPAFART